MKVWLGLFLLLMSACRMDTAPILVWHTVQTGTLELSLEESGEIASASEVLLRAPFDGTLTQLLPEGTVLKKGQILARMDTSSQQVEYDNARFSLEEARFDHDLAVLEEKIRREKASADQTRARMLARLEALKLKQLQTERDQAALIRVRQQLKSLAQRRALLELEAQERARLFALGYLSRQEKEQAQLQLEETHKERQRLEAELKVLEQGVPVQLIEKQRIQVQKANQEVQQARRQGQIHVRVAEVMKKSAEGRMRTYQGRMTYYQDLITRGIFRAPISGTLVYGKLQVGQEQVPIKAGDAVKEGMELVRIVDLAQPLVRLTLHEIDAPQVQTGQRAAVRLDAWPALLLQGRVQRVLPVARQILSNDRQELQGVTCEVRLDRSDPHLRPGMTAQVRIILKAITGLLVPSQAIVQADRKSWVWVQDATGQPRKREVHTGASDAHQTHIHQGLKAGERVLLNPHTLQAGSAAL